MNITALDLILVVASYFAFSLIATTIGMYLQYYLGMHIKKLQIAYLNKNAPEVEDERGK